MSLRLVLLLFIFSISTGSAHPVAQGSMEIVVHQERVKIHARVSVEEAFVAEGFAKDTPADNPEAIWARHGEYLLKHLFVDADGTRLVGRLVKITPPPNTIPTERINYEMEYGIPSGKIPKHLAFTQNVLNEFEFAIGNPWEATFVTTISQSGGTAKGGLLFTRKAPINFICDWISAQSPAGATQIDRGRIFWEYVHHGVMHILTGYDHLLFMAGLVLAATRLLDLVKVITAFTLAHSVTLALSVLNILRLPSHIVEPIIAASIVFIAAQNIFFPAQSRGWTRLLVAFGFGLFHGLGFAGGLLDAMEGLPGLAVATAIVAFSLGVEVGHQAVVLPLYFGQNSRYVSAASIRLFNIQKYASAVVCLAGIYYLVMALR